MKGSEMSNNPIRAAASRKGLTCYSPLTADGIWFGVKEFKKSKYQQLQPYKSESRKGIAGRKGLAGRNNDLFCSEHFRLYKAISCILRHPSYIMLLGIQAEGIWMYHLYFSVLEYCIF